MLRALVVRQAFLIMDLLLAVLMALVAYMIVVRAFVQHGPENPLDDSTDGTAAVSPLEFPAVGPISEYASIAAGGMFGPSARFRAEAVETLDTGTEVEPPAELRLLGTTTAAGSKASAQIENRAAKTVDKVDTYFVGDHVTDSLVLAEVRQRRVVLFDARRKQRAVLEMDETGSTAVASRAVPTQGGPRPTPTRPNYAVLKRTEVVTEMTVNGADLVSRANPQMYYDDNGNIAGITSDNLSNIPLARRAGLQSRDVVQTVNGVAIDSEEKIAEIFHRFQNATTFRLGILRNGKPVTLTVNLE
jgi:type II secretory pathway component PulC